jgi:hypothetical protein
MATARSPLAAPNFLSVYKRACGCRKRSRCGSSRRETGCGYRPRLRRFSVWRPIVERWATPAWSVCRPAGRCVGFSSQRRGRRTSATVRAKTTHRLRRSARNELSDLTASSGARRKANGAVTCRDFNRKVVRCDDDDDNDEDDELRVLLERGNVSAAVFLLLDRAAAALKSERTRRQSSAWNSFFSAAVRAKQRC